MYLVPALTDVHPIFTVERVRHDYIVEIAPARGAHFLKLKDAQAERGKGIQLVLLDLRPLAPALDRSYNAFWIMHSVLSIDS